MASAHPGLLALVAVQLLIFVLSLPGLGIETRTPGQYAAWAGPIFLVLTLLVFLLGIGALASSRSRPTWVPGLSAGQGVMALLTNLLDISQIGGPAPPTGPLILGVVSIVVALLTIGIASSSKRFRSA